MTGSKAVRERLEQILAALPVLPDRRADIGREAARLDQVALLHRINDLPRAKRAGARVAVQELDKLAKLARRLEEHIQQVMHREALDAVDRQRSGARPPLKLANDLRGVINAAQCARDAVPPTPAAPDLHSKKQAAGVTKQAAQAFERLTGRAVGRSVRSVPFKPGRRRSIDAGPFVRFLGDVFKVLEIDASAAGQIKLLLRKKVP